MGQSVVDKSGVYRVLRKHPFLQSNGRKTTFEWPKVVSEVSFPTFWGGFRSIKVVFVSEIGSAVSEIWRIARCYAFDVLFVNI